MENININLPAACYNVEKILGVARGQGNQKNYKVQWTPTWVSEIHLLGCDQLIKQFLNEGEETSDTDSCRQDESIDQVKEEDKEEEEDPPLQENETTPDVDISSALQENTSESQQDTTSTETAEVESNNDTEAREDITGTLTANENEVDILLGDVKEEPEEEANTEEMVVSANDIKVEETEECPSTEVEDVPTNHNIAENTRENTPTESEETESSDPCSQPVHTDVTMRNRSTTNHDTFNINGENYHFGQYLKEKDVSSNFPTSSSTDWKKMRKQVFTYEDVSAYPSYPETHTITVDKPKPTKQLLSRKRPIAHEVCTTVKCPNGVQNIHSVNNIHFSHQQPSSKSLKTNQQNVEVYVATPMTLISAPMTGNESIHTNSDSIISSMDIQTNSGIASSSTNSHTHSVKTPSIDTSVQVCNSKGPCVTNTYKQSVVDLTDEEDACTFTKYTSGGNSFRITGMQHQMNNFIKIGDPGAQLHMSTSSSGGCNSASNGCNSFIPTMTSRNEPSVSNEVNGSRSSQLAHTHGGGGGDGSQNTLVESQNSFHQQTSNAGDLQFEPVIVVISKHSNATPHDGTELHYHSENGNGGSLFDISSQDSNENQEFVHDKYFEPLILESGPHESYKTTSQAFERPTFCTVDSSNPDTDINTDYLCNHCNVSFVYEELYNEHMKIHDVKIFQCRFCPRQFVDEPGVKRHETTRHNATRGYECDVCGVKIKDFSNLKVHIRRKHTMERPFRCNECPKRFVTSTDLKKHVRVHTGERPYVCSFCSLTFNASSHLSTHVKRFHTTQKDYECEICAKQFGLRYDLNNHVKKVHHKKKKKRGTFECDVCLQSFKTETAMLVHNRQCRFSTD